MEGWFYPRASIFEPSPQTLWEPGFVQTAQFCHLPWLQLCNIWQCQGSPASAQVRQDRLPRTCRLWDRDEQEKWSCEDGTRTCLSVAVILQVQKQPAKLQRVSTEGKRLRCPLSLSLAVPNATLLIQINPVFQGQKIFWIQGANLANLLQTPGSWGDSLLGGTGAGWDALWAGLGRVRQRLWQTAVAVSPWLPQECQEWHHMDPQHSCRHPQFCLCTSGPVMGLLCRNRKDTKNWTSLKIRQIIFCVCLHWPARIHSSGASHCPSG